MPSLDDEVASSERRKWLRDINRFEHTIDLRQYTIDGNTLSWGYYLDRSFKTQEGEFIGDKPEVQAIAAVWHGANAFFAILGDVSRQAEVACNVIAALNSVQRHDIVLDDEMWSIINNMHHGNRQRSAISFALSEMNAIKQRLEYNAGRLRGVFRGKHKVKVEGKLDRFIKEQEAMMRSFEQVAAELSMPQTPYQVRQYVLSELIDQVGIAVEHIAPMRRAIKDSPLPPEILKSIVDNEAALYRARSQLRKWRDNPSQKFGAKMKEMAIHLNATCNEMCKLKDQSYIAASKLGIQFLDRCGTVKILTPEPKL